MTLAAALAAFHGASLEEARAALCAGPRGEAEALRPFGLLLCGSGPVARYRAIREQCGVLS